MGSLIGKHCRHRAVWCLLMISFRWAGFYLERSRQSAAKEIPAFKKCKRSHQGNVTALLCGRVFSALLRCVCVSPGELLCHKSHSFPETQRFRRPFMLGSGIVEGWFWLHSGPVLSPSRRVLSTDQTALGPAFVPAGLFFTLFFFVSEKADLDPLVLLLPGPVHSSVWWSVSLSDCHSMRHRTSLFPCRARVYPLFPPSLYSCRSPCLSLSLLSSFFKKQLRTCHSPSHSSCTSTQWCQLPSKRTCCWLCLKSLEVAHWCRYQICIMTVIMMGTARLHKRNSVISSQRKKVLCLICLELLIKRQAFCCIIIVSYIVLFLYY